MRHFLQTFQRRITRRSSHHARTLSALLAPMTDGVRTEVRMKLSSSGLRDQPAFRANKSIKNLGGKVTYGCEIDEGV